ncbi:MAG TPA: hypothetical protein VJ867_16950 [Gemmatimonadaceae bacterium]|nr:hypothetical protein [Gemmatimonadaceae bacterium]
MRSLKLGALALLVVVTGILLLWVTDALPAKDLRDLAPKAIGAVLILMLAGFAWDSFRQPDHVDASDKPAP